MSFNYNRTIRSTANYSSNNASHFTAQTSDAWDDAIDVTVDTYEDQEASFWSNDDEDDDMECGFFNN